jgi:hypothetical protein
MHKTLRAQTLHYFARPHERIPKSPIVSAADWRGDAMARSDEWLVALEPAQIDEIRSAIAYAEARGAQMEALTPADFPLPMLTPAIAEWRREIRHGRGFVLIRGVPVGEWTEAQSELFFWGLGLHLGIPGAQNPRGDLLGHVRDERTTGDKRFYRTNKALDVHCDAADVVGLLCLQKAKSGGLSRIASSVAVFNELLRRKPQLVSRLFAPFYFDTKGEGGVNAFPVRPCRYADGELRTFWQSDYYRTVAQYPRVPRLTPDEHELLDTYDAIASEPQFHLDMDLEPGDVQLLSNHTILHARTKFEDWPEPERRRHLLRLWISLPENRSLKLRLLILRSWAELLITTAWAMLRLRRAPAKT